MILNIGTPKTFFFHFGQMEKSMALDVPILRHSRASIHKPEGLCKVNGYISMFFAIFN